MLLPTLRQAVLEANLELVRHGLVLYTFGNVSGISREEGLVAIKPSGVSYETMSAADIVVTDLNGRVMEGNLRPSSDLATHLKIYSHFSDAGGVAHTHSEFATAWAQARFMTLPSGRGWTRRLARIWKTPCCKWAPGPAPKSRAGKLPR